MLRALCFAFCVFLVGCEGDVATPATDDGSGDTVTDPMPGGNSGAGVVTVDGGGFSLVLGTDALTLVEGTSSQISIQVQRDAGEDLPVVLSLAVESGSVDTPLQVALSDSSVGAAESGATLTVGMPISRLPIQPRQDRIVVSATNGSSDAQLSVDVSVTPTSAPDVYLLVGQSNMEGASEDDAKDSSPGGPDETNRRIRQLNVVQNEPSLWNDSDFTNESSNVVEPRFITAEDPLHQPRDPLGDSKGGTTVGMGLTFAKTALQNTTADIVLVPAAWSATGFCAGEDPELAWNAERSSNAEIGGTLLADRALTRLDMTLRDTGGIWRGILWHQGENDSNDAVCAQQYQNNLISLVDRLRTEARVDGRGAAARGDDADIPFVLGTMSFGDDERGEFSFVSDTKMIVDSVHRNIADNLAWSATVIADDLVPPAWSCGQGSCVHFGSAAYRELGVRYYNALVAIQP